MQNGRGGLLLTDRLMISINTMIFAEPTSKDLSLVMDQGYCPWPPVNVCSGEHKE